MPAETKAYNYKQLKSCELGKDKQHFYAVILDAQFPHKSFKSEKYLCSMKIADQSSIINNDGIIEYCNLVFFANKFEDLPISQRVGDIIRVHRASVQNYKESKQFTANIFFNSSWALFSPNIVKGQNKQEEFRPFQFFGKQLSFDQFEQKILKNLRKWLSTSFAENKILSN